MDNTVVTAVPIVGILIPIIISFAKNAHWPSWFNLFLSIALCLGAGTVVFGYTQGFDGTSVEDIVGYGGAIFTIAQVVYKTWFAGSVLDNWLTEKLWGSK